MRKSYRNTLIILTVVNIAFIWGNSLMPAEVSRALSTFVRDVLNNLLSFLNTFSQTEELSSDGPLRKIAHSTEFLLLAVWLTQLFFRTHNKIYGTLFCGVMVALLD